MVPNGKFIRLSADSTMVRMRAHGLNLSRPTPAKMPGSDNISMNTPSAAPVKPRMGTAIQASGSDAAPATPMTLRSAIMPRPKRLPRMPNAM